MEKIDDLFESHALTSQGVDKVTALKRAFTRCLAAVEEAIPAGRERSVVATHLQQACMMAVRGVSVQRENQQG